jgi:hypothetical protein
MHTKESSLALPPEIGKKGKTLLVRGIMIIPGCEKDPHIQLETKRDELVACKQITLVLLIITHMTRDMILTLNIHLGIGLPANNTLTPRDLVRTTPHDHKQLEPLFSAHRSEGKFVLMKDQALVTMIIQYSQTLDRRSDLELLGEVRVIKTQEKSQVLVLIQAMARSPKKGDLLPLDEGISLLRLAKILRDPEIIQAIIMYSNSLE